MKLRVIALLMAVLGLLFLPLVLTEGDNADLDTDITNEDKEKFDEILQPVVKIYNFIKYIATIVAAIFLLFAGISFMTSGDDPKKRDQAKSIATYVIIGLLVIWAAPFIVDFLI